MGQLTLFMMIFFSMNGFAQNQFNYNSTQNESMSKYQRIGHIESYLKAMSKDIRQMKANIESKMKTGDQNLLRKIDSLERTVSMLKAQMTELKKEKAEGSTQTQETLESAGTSGANTNPTSSQMNKSDQDKLLDAIEENATKIGILQESYRSIENSLKSINESLQESAK